MCITTGVDSKYALPITDIDKYKCINCRKELYDKKSQCFHCGFSIINFEHDLCEIVTFPKTVIDALETYNFHDVFEVVPKSLKVERMCRICKKCNYYFHRCPQCTFNVILFCKYCKNVCKFNSSQINLILRLLDYN